MIKNIFVGIIIAVLVIALFLVKRPADPPHTPHPGPPPPDRPMNLRIRQGIVTGYTHNAHLDVNAMQIQTENEGALSVEFRPHTAKTVMQCAPVGDSVKISTGSAPNDEYVVYQLHRIENLKTHQLADLDALPPPPDVPQNSHTETFTFDQPQLLTDPYGGLDGIRSGSMLFHFRPGMVDDISGLIKKAHRITLTAIRRSDEFGFVNSNNDKVYIVLSVTIDHKTFLVR